MNAVSDRMSDEEWNLRMDAALALAPGLYTVLVSADTPVNEATVDVEA